MAENLVKINGNEYIVKAVPIAKIGMAFSSLVKPLKDLAESGDDLKLETVVSTLAVQSGKKLEEFIKTFVPTLPDGFLNDPENGPTLPELIDLLVAIYRVNRMDSVNSFFRNLIPKDAARKAIEFMQTQQARPLTKSSSSAQKLTDGNRKKQKA